MEKPNARELLKECRGALLRGQADEQMAMVAGIDTFLAAPSESAMEMARETVDTMGREMLALGKEIDTSYGPMQPPEIQEDKAIPYLAALIEGLQRRVPRKMLNDIMAEYKICKEAGYSDLIYLARVNGIVAKHGVVIEEGQ